MILKKHRYPSDDDANMRLKGTILRYKGRPVFAGYCEEATIHFNFLDTGNSGSCHHSDTDLDITPIPLGWFKPAEQPPIYCMRGPRRAHKQGLHLPSIKYFNGKSLHQGLQHQSLTQLSKAFVPERKSFSSLAREGVVLTRLWALVPLEKVGWFTLFHKYIEVGLYCRGSDTLFVRRSAMTRQKQIILNRLKGSARVHTIG